MKVIVAGTRSGFPRLARIVAAAVHDSGWRDKIVEIVSGASGAVDLAGEAWAAANGVPLKQFPADWGKFGKSAGPRRNQQMADYADAFIAIWDGQSRGTADMIQRARTRGIPVYESVAPHVHLWRGSVLR